MNFPPKPESNPTYTPEQRKQIAASFRAAKSMLWDGVSKVDLEGPCITRFVCQAITGTWLPVAPLARTEISRRLAGCVTVGTWLNREAGVPWCELTDRALQEFRHAWLDSLIAEFEGTEE